MNEETIRSQPENANPNALEADQQPQLTEPPITAYESTLRVLDFLGNVDPKVSPVETIDVALSIGPIRQRTELLKREQVFDEIADKQRSQTGLDLADYDAALGVLAYESLTSPEAGLAIAHVERAAEKLRQEQAQMVAKESSDLEEQPAPPRQQKKSPLLTRRQLLGGGAILAVFAAAGVARIIYDKSSDENTPVGRPPAAPERVRTDYVPHYYGSVMVLEGTKIVTLEKDPQSGETTLREVKFEDIMRVNQTNAAEPFRGFILPYPEITTTMGNYVPSLPRDVAQNQIIVFPGKIAGDDHWGIRGRKLYIEVSATNAKTMLIENNNQRGKWVEITSEKDSTVIRNLELYNKPRNESVGATFLPKAKP